MVKTILFTDNEASSYGGIGDKVASTRCERGAELAEYHFPLVRHFVGAKSGQQPRTLVSDALHDPGAVQNRLERHRRLGVH